MIKSGWYVEYSSYNFRSSIRFDDYDDALGFAKAMGCPKPEWVDGS